MWLLLVLSGVAIVVFIERALYCHRSQINSAEFLNGVRTVLKRDNIVEALSICDATPGPVARLVRAAIVNREKGKEGVREVLEDAGLVEVPRLEAKLNLLATVAQIAPLLGLLGTVFGWGVMQVLSRVPTAGRMLAGPVPLGVFCQGFALALGMGVLGGLYPAYRAAKLVPTEGLRHE